MSSDAPLNDSLRSRPPVGEATLERLLTPESGSVAPGLEEASRLPPLPEPNEQQGATAEDTALSERLLKGDSLVGVTGGEEGDRAQLILRYLRQERLEGRAWLWAELGGQSGALHIFEALFGLLRIPVPYGLTQLLRQIDEEDSIDCSLSDDALEEYELARTILSSALLMRRASGLALHLHSDSQADDPELKVLISQLTMLSARLPVIISATHLTADLDPLLINRRAPRALPSLSRHEDELEPSSVAWATDELLMTLTLLGGGVSQDDLIALAPPVEGAVTWSAEGLAEALVKSGYLKPLEAGYVMTSEGRSQGNTLILRSDPDQHERRERRFVQCFARYGQPEEIEQLDGEEGGAQTDRYIEVKPHLEAALDVAIAYGWPEAAELALAIAAFAERHGPSLLAQRPLVLALRVALPERLRLTLELKLNMLQSGTEQLVTTLESLRARARELSDDELYVEVTYNLAKERQRRGENLIAYRLMRELKQRFDRRVSERMMIQVLNTLGFACFILQRDDEAYDHLTQAVERARVAGSLRLQARSLTNLGVYYSRRGEHLEARRTHQAAINIHQHLKSYVELCPSLCNLADAYRLEGLHEEALRLFERTMKVSVAFGNHSTLALVWGNLGEEQLAVGMVEDAEASLKRGVQLLKERGNHSIAGIFLGVLGYLYGVYHEFSSAQEAHAAFSEGDELLTGVHGLEGERAKLWLKWGLARVKWGQLEEASRAYLFAQQLSQHHTDVELKLWFDRLQTHAEGYGVSFPLSGEP